MFLTAKNVHFNINKNLSLTSINLDIQPKQKWVFMGPNGAGKSTLLHLLTGMQRHQKGTITLNGKNLSSLTTKHRAQYFAIVYQQEYTEIPLNVVEYIKLGKIPRSKETDIYSIEELLHSLSLWHLRHQPLLTLSGGEQQKVKIARAVYQQPKILFLDEPTNHLDPSVRHDLLDWLVSLDITLVMVLHDLGLAKQFSTHTALIQQGKIVHAGESNIVLNPVTLSHLFNIPVIDIPHPIHQEKSAFIVYDYQPTKNKIHRNQKIKTNALNTAIPLA